MTRFARFGGDEFVVLLANLGTQKAKAAALQAEAIGEKNSRSLHGGLFNSIRMNIPVHPALA